MAKPVKTKYDDVAADTLRDFLCRGLILDLLPEENDEDMPTYEVYSPLSHYQKNPVAFGREQLKIRYTHDVHKMMESVRDNVITICPSGNALGKSQPLSLIIPVPTTTGYIRFGDLKVGDEVYGSDGRPTEITGIFPQGLQPTYLVKLEDGGSTLASADHLWLASFFPEKGCKPVWGTIETSKLLPGMILPAMCYQMLGDFRKIESITEVLPQESMCIRVAAEDHLYATTDYILTHNTHGAASTVIWFAKCFPGAQVYTAAAPPEDNLRRLLWGEISKIVEHQKALFQNDKISSLNISTGANSFVTGVTIPSSGDAKQREARFSGKHAPYLLFVLDEADAIPDEVFNGIESCMSGGHARLLILYNPRATQGRVYQMVKNGLGNIVKLTAFTHPNVIKGEDVFPGAVNREVTVRRINQWTAVIPEDELEHDTSPFPVDKKHKQKPINPVDAYLVPECLVDTIAKSYSGEDYPPVPYGWRRVINPSFSYMVLAEYPSLSENQLISQVDIEKARKRWDDFVKENGQDYMRLQAHIDKDAPRPIQGQDVAEYGADENIATVRYPNGFVPMPEKWSGVDPLTTGRNAHAFYQKYNCKYAMVDANGVGASIAPHMVELGDTSYGLKMQSAATDTAEEGEFRKLRDQCWWGLREWIRNGDKTGAMLPPDDKLLEELAAPSYRIKDGKLVVTDSDTLRDILKRSADRASSLSFTFGPVPYGAGPVNEYDYFEDSLGDYDPEDDDPYNVGGF